MTLCGFLHRLFRAHPFFILNLELRPHCDLHSGLRCSTLSALKTLSLMRMRPGAVVFRLRHGIDACLIRNKPVEARRPSSSIRGPTLEISTENKSAITQEAPEKSGQAQAPSAQLRLSSLTSSPMRYCDQKLINDRPQVRGGFRRREIEVLHFVDSPRNPCLLSLKRRYGNPP